MIPVETATLDVIAGQCVQLRLPPSNPAVQHHLFYLSTDFALVNREEGKEEMVMVLKPLQSGTLPITYREECGGTPVFERQYLVNVPYDAVAQRRRCRHHFA